MHIKMILLLQKGWLAVGIEVCAGYLQGEIEWTNLRNDTGKSGITTPSDLPRWSSQLRTRVSQPYNNMVISLYHPIQRTKT